MFLFIPTLIQLFRDYVCHDQGTCLLLMVIRCCEYLHYMRSIFVGNSGIEEFSRKSGLYHGLINRAGCWHRNSQADYFRPVGHVGWGAVDIKQHKLTWPFTPPSLPFILSPELPKIVACLDLSKSSYRVSSLVQDRTQDLALALNPNRFVFLCCCCCCCGFGVFRDLRGGNRPKDDSSSLPSHYITTSTTTQPLSITIEINLDPVR